MGEPDFWALALVPDEFPAPVEVPAPLELPDPPALGAVFLADESLEPDSPPVEDSDFAAGCFVADLASRLSVL